VRTPHLRGFCGRTLKINYFIADSIDTPLQFAIRFNLIRNVIVPDHNAGSGYATKKATQGDSAFARYFPAQVNSHISGKIPLFPLFYNGLTSTCKLFTNKRYQVFRGKPGFQTSKLKIPAVQPAVPRRLSLSAASEVHLNRCCRFVWKATIGFWITNIILIRRLR
jgi:hypothetical protein